MSEQADRDALAEVIGGHLPQSRGAGRWPGCFSHPRIEDWTPDHLADVILASDWLAQRDRRVAAEAWGEGYEAGRDDELFDQRGLSTDSDAHEYPHANPYRADRIERGE